MKNLLLVSLFLATFAISRAKDYCNSNLCGTTRHTTCLNPNPSSECGQVEAVRVTEAEKQEIIDTHNKLRAQVAAGLERRGNPGPQPPAKYMPALKWDQELADIAQIWANQCKFQHDRCRSVDRFGVGQNLGLIGTTGKNTATPKNIIESWYNEVAKFNRAEVSDFRSAQGVGHYTQLVWAKTTLVGCGKIIYRKDGWSNYYLACNYGPAGNYIGEPIYEIA